MAIVAGVMSALASAVRHNYEHCSEQGLATQHARVAIERIGRAVRGAYASESHPGCAVAYAGADPAALLVWRPAAAPGPMTERERLGSAPHRLADIGLAEVRAAYTTTEGDISELIMGEQVHIGGLLSSRELADRAGIQAGSSGVDLCCCTGAGMRFLVRFRGVRRMVGVDATESMIELGRRRTDGEGLTDRMAFVHADACATGLPDGSADFVWGEDAWCYVADKERLIAEAVRIVRAGGVVAFTDWLHGPVRMTSAEAERFLRFMTFPGLLGLEEYRRRDTIS